jgi:hypothetical protein
VKVDADVNTVFPTPFNCIINLCAFFFNENIPVSGLGIGPVIEWKPCKIKSEILYDFKLLFLKTCI